MESVTLKLTGIAPILMHNGRLADQLDPVVRELKNASKGAAKSTVAGQDRIARLEYLGSLYMREDGTLYLPATAIERSFRDGSVGAEKGLKKKFAAAVIINDDAVFTYGGKKGKTADALYDAGHLLRIGAAVNRARVMRTRPQFKDWTATVQVWYHPAIVDLDTLLRAARYAGQVEGIGDWRPRFGRFTVEAM